jgi:hypothetical protein
VQQGNSWLTYGEPMHRLREFGVLIKEIDMLDSNKLSLDQIRKFCTIMYVTTHCLIFCLDAVVCQPAFESPAFMVAFVLYLQY